MDLPENIKVEIKMLFSADGEDLSDAEIAEIAENLRRFASLVLESLFE